MHWISFNLDDLDMLRNCPKCFISTTRNFDYVLTSECSGETAHISLRAFTLRIHKEDPDILVYDQSFGIDAHIQV